jgi:hypothetical protein
MRVFVYFNLHRKCLSVKALEGTDKGRVIFHADRVMLRGADFRVQQGARARVLSTGRKAVHAGIVGTLEGMTGEMAPGWTRPHDLGALFCDSWHKSDRDYVKFARKYGKAVTYNPYFHKTFVDRHSLEPVKTSPMVYVDKARECFAFDPCAI